MEGSATHRAVSFGRIGRTPIYKPLSAPARAHARTHARLRRIYEPASDASEEAFEWPYLSTDDVVWLASEARWVGRTSPKLSERAREAAALTRRMSQHNSPAPATTQPEAKFDDLF
jgi:hypothetical protein